MTIMYIVLCSPDTRSASSCFAIRQGSVLAAVARLESSVSKITSSASVAAMDPGVVLLDRSLFRPIAVHYIRCTSKGSAIIMTEAV